MERVSNDGNSACWLDKIEATRGIAEVMGQNPQSVPLVQCIGEAQQQEGLLRVSWGPIDKGARSKRIEDVGLLGEEGVGPPEKVGDGPNVETLATGR